MRLLMHPDIRHRISDEAIQNVSEREQSASSNAGSSEKSPRTAPNFLGERKRRPYHALSSQEAEDEGSASDTGYEASAMDDGSDGDGTEDEDGSLGDSGDGTSTVAETRRPTMKSILSEKHDLLFRMNRLIARGGKQSRTMTASDSLDELRAECERMQRELDTEKSVKFQRSVLISFATGVECLNSRFDVAGIRLDGWSDSMSQDIASFDEVFEELHEKYGGKSMMPPEIKLVFMIASSAFMFHMSKSMFSGVPGMSEAMRDDPELAKAVAAAVAKKASQNETAAPEKRGTASIFANIMGAGARGAPRGKPMSMPDDDSLDGVEQLFSDSSADSGSGSGSNSRASSSVGSSSRSSRSKRRSPKRAGQKKSADSEFILDA